MILEMKVQTVEKSTIERIPESEIAENPAVIYTEGKLEKSKTNNKNIINTQISNLKKEIERIHLADSKVKDAKSRDIPLSAVADDISMAGLSILEREEKIKMLKNSKISVAKNLKKMVRNLNTFLHF